MGREKENIRVKKRVDDEGSGLFTLATKPYREEGRLLFLCHCPWQKILWVLISLTTLAVAAAESVQCTYLLRSQDK